MSKHTKEPWSLRDARNATGVIVGGQEREVSGVKKIQSQIASVCMQDWMSFSEKEANARRIVACVNACAGIETDRLEQIPKLKQDPLPIWTAYCEKKMQLEDVTEQRDELLTAANAAMEWWEEHQYDCDGDYNRYSDDPEFVLLARDAIAKAKGGAA